jgi:hypothetical protein
VSEREGERKRGKEREREGRSEKVREGERNEERGEKQERGEVVCGVEMDRWKGQGVRGGREGGMYCGCVGAL